MSKEIKIKVRGYHLDGYQHVNNARYLEFFEEARWAFFEESDALKTLQKKNIMFVVVNVNINYRYPASVGQTIVIKSKLQTLAEVGSKTSTFKQTIYLENTDTIVCDAVVTFVLFDGKTQRAIATTEEIREMFVGELSN
ncbi:thioesterase family protein [Bernardetia sp. Wsw4-3y2]|uniref:acyl-CoA thioesterase n=1 Tax=Bernardetia sp. Wsw4-3y2 TaxID=3127471 RepID=UPI0030D55B21